MQIITTQTLPPLAGPFATSQDGIELGICYCPSMDLIASFPRLKLDMSQEQRDTLEELEDPYADNDENYPSVEVYRLNGQRVFGIVIESDRKAVGVVDVAWRSDGIILAIFSSDNTIRLVNSFSGKVVHKFSSISMHMSATSPLTSHSSAPPKSPSVKRSFTARGESPRKRRCLPTILSYATHFLDDGTILDQLTTANEESGTVLDDLLGLNADLGKLLKVKADLPKQLASIDVEAFLPKMSTLPGASFGDDDVFSTRTSIDAMFHPTKSGSRSSSVDLLIAGHDDGRVHLRMFDSFEVGDLDLNRASHMPPGLHLNSALHITGHPLRRELFAIVEEEPDGPAASHTRSHGNPDAKGKTLHLLRLDLRIVHHPSHNLPTLAMKSTQLQNLIRYMQQIETQISREVKIAFDLPTRFIRNVNEDLAEESRLHSTFETAACHAILTGEVHGKMKEWLSEQVGDRGVKRWEKAVGDCLDLTRRLISENWNPAVERAGVVVSRLTGLAAANASLGVDKRIVEGLRDTIDVMAIVGEDIIRDVSAEITNFSAFIKWLRWEIEAAGLEETSERLDEMREGSDHGDTRKMLEYISGGLSESTAKKFVIDTTPEDVSVAEQFDDIGFYSHFKDLRNKHGVKNNIPSLKTLLNRLSSQCQRLFEQIAETLKRGVLIDYILKLPDRLDDAIMDVRIISSQGSEQSKIDRPILSLYVVSKDKLKPGQLSCTTIHTDSTRVEAQQSREYSVEGWEEIVDIKFAGDDEVMVLVSTGGSFKIFASKPTNLSHWVVRHDFSMNDGGFVASGMKPGNLEINGRKGRRAVTVVDQDGRGYGVFDLDTDRAEDDSDGDDQIMTG